MTSLTADLAHAPGFQDVRLLPYAVELLSLRRPDTHAIAEDVKFANMTYHEVAVLENEALRLAGHHDFYETDIRELNGQHRLRAARFLDWSAFPVTRGLRGAP